MAKMTESTESTTAPSGSASEVRANAEAAKLPQNQGILMPVGLLKLTILSMTTLGLYQAYWMYRNWRYLKKLHRTKIRPNGRADYPFFFVYPLFKQIRALGLSIEPAVPSIAPFWLFAAWVGLTLLVNLPDPYYFMGTLDVLPLLCVQAYVNKLNQATNRGDLIDYAMTRRDWLNVALGIAANIVVLCISLKLG